MFLNVLQKIYININIQFANYLFKFINNLSIFAFFLSFCSRTDLGLFTPSNQFIGFKRNLNRIIMHALSSACYKSLVWALEAQQLHKIFGPQILFIYEYKIFNIG